VHLLSWSKRTLPVCRGKEGDGTIPLKTIQQGRKRKPSISFPCLLLFFLQLVKIIPRGLAIFRSCT
jgi:hypothetical protein